MEGYILKYLNQIKQDSALREFGYVFQEYAPFPELTALENVFLPAMAHGRKKQINIKKARVAEQLDLASFASPPKKCQEASSSV